MTTFQREFEEEVRDDLHHLLGGLRMDGAVLHTDHRWMFSNEQMPVTHMAIDLPPPTELVRKVSEFDLQNAFENWFNTAPKAKLEDYSIFK